MYKLTAEGKPPTAGGIGIGVGPVTVADYLSRPNLVMQEGGNKLAIAESHRWAGELEDNIARVMAANLGNEMRTSHVLTYPWNGDEGLSYQITLDIRELHGHAEGHAVLDAAWRVYSLPGRTMVTSRTWTATEPFAADGYEELVAAESRLLARLARQIRASLK
ncbi:MAG: PqiC family protein [Prosthecobacter sp.]